MTEISSVYILGLWPPSPHFLHALKKNKKRKSWLCHFSPPQTYYFHFRPKRNWKFIVMDESGRSPVLIYLFWTRNCLFFCLVFSRFLTHGHTQLFGLSQQLLKTSLCLMYGERVIKKDRSGRAKQLQAKLQGVKDENKTPHSNKSKKH